ncbi:hypothetical protein N4R57_17735 [Rhodobacteraceae bacterium D3-12]|nr:hypothetical protein N4R57_17735 [Rhodobacteraceae bacterium D3-12]
MAEERAGAHGDVDLMRAGDGAEDANAIRFDLSDADGEAGFVAQLVDEGFHHVRQIIQARRRAAQRRQSRPEDIPIGRGGLAQVAKVHEAAQVAVDSAFGGFQLLGKGGYAEA